MKRAALVALLGMAALACGGGGGGGGGGTTFRDPDSVSFEFGTGQAPTATEQDAATNAASAVQNVLSIDSASGASAGEMVGTIAQLPAQMASGLFEDSIGPDDGGSAQVSMSRRAAAYLKGDTAAATAGFEESCVSVGTDDIVFTNCSESFTEQGITMTETLNGAFHRAAGHVWWDATMAMSISGTIEGTAISYSFGYHMTGDITFGDGSIDGFERVDLSVKAKEGTSLNASAALTYSVDIALDYLTDPEFCLNQGTLTVKLIWTEKPRGTGVPAEAQDVSDAAVRLTWTAPSATECANAVTVAVGTLN